ncbi:DUF4350 domain-containing protein [Flammeovirga pectinis]|uniref:DUF4350 domain-containing protein n=1 Tax=Flammeovirga pectinis TaxID=2494373 RepID=A0A3Q9FRZ2_9BACT|nr:DUF4350 domain-containing protein [Flammeovirga pectinis]AZQ64693.1 DUF4350 domain-containing protein [Flammeovirga pectinis]
MKTFNKQYLFLGIAVVLYLVLTLTSGTKTDWDIHYKSLESSPYGTAALTQLLKAPEVKMEVENLRLTPYEIYDSLSESYSDNNLIIIGNQLELDKVSIESMLREAKNGRSILLAAEEFSRLLRDTLGFTTENNYSSIQIKDFDLKNGVNLEIDSVSLKTANNVAYFSDFELISSFNNYDTFTTEVLAKNENDTPVFIKVSVGNGAIYLLSTPKILTNIALLNNNNYKVISDIITTLPEGKYIRTEYYTLGRVGHQSLFRVVLSKLGLKEALQLLLLLLLIYLVFEAKREQRPLPEIIPLANESIGFIKTLSHLYVTNGTNKSILVKRKRYLLNHIRNKYYVNLTTDEIDQDIVLLSLRSGINEEELRQLFITVDKEITNPLTDGGFISANKLIDNFYSKEI